jgi:hypothetical protein
MIEKFLAVWCRHMHRGAMWPMHGKYTCSQCLRQHPVGWEVLPLMTAPVRAAARPVPAASASMDVCA